VAKRNGGGENINNRRKWRNGDGERNVGWQQSSVAIINGI
jgi:hypothetical protein